MPAPVLIPLQCPTAFDHSARYIPALWRNTPSGCPRTDAIAFRDTGHSRAPYQNVTLRTEPGSHANECYECITGFVSYGGWAWLVISACAIHFPSGNAGQAQAWPFGAPDGAISIPHTCWRAFKHFAIWNDGCEQS